MYIITDPCGIGVRDLELGAVSAQNRAPVITRNYLTESGVRRRIHYWFCPDSDDPRSINGQLDGSILVIASGPM